jgi:hypothetical protein
MHPILRDRSIPAHATRNTAAAVIGRCDVHCFQSDMAPDEFCRVTGSRAAKVLRVSTAGADRRQPNPINVDSASSFVSFPRAGPE